MPTDAMRLGSVYFRVPRERRTSPVLGSCYRFHVPSVDAERGPAQVVYVETIGYRAAPHLVGDAVRIPGLPCDVDRSVATNRRRCPEPATRSVVASERNLRPEPALNSQGDRHLPSLPVGADSPGGCAHVPGVTMSPSCGVDGVAMSLDSSHRFTSGLVVGNSTLFGFEVSAASVCTNDRASYSSVGWKMWKQYTLLAGHWCPPNALRSTRVLMRQSPVAPAQELFWLS